MIFSTAIEALGPVIQIGLIQIKKANPVNEFYVSNNYVVKIQSLGLNNDS